MTRRHRSAPLRVGVAAAGVLALVACSPSAGPTPTISHPGPGPSTGPGQSSGPGGVRAFGGQRIFSPDSFWYADVRDAPANPDSARMVDALTGQLRDRYGGVAAFNVRQYTANIVSVGAGQPRHDVVFDNCQHKGYVPQGLTGKKGEFRGVPIPDSAIPAAGRDSSLSVYDRDSSTLWELWRVKKQPDGWHACWGGRIDDTRTNPGYFHNGFGSTASGLAQLAGAVQLSDIRAGTIDHAMALAIPNVAPWKDVSWPAQRSDGSSTSDSPIPMGTRFRLDPSIDVNSLGLGRLATMVAHAAQQYGFIVTDKAGAVSVIGESGATEQAISGTDPWNAILDGAHTYQVLKGFPWDKLQALPRDYGQPSSQS